MGKDQMKKIVNTIHYYRNLILFFHSKEILIFKSFFLSFFFFKFIYEEFEFFFIFYFHV